MARKNDESLNIVLEITSSSSDEEIIVIEGTLKRKRLTAKTKLTIIEEYEA